MRILIAAATLIITVFSSPAGADKPSKYVGEETRDIKALSSQQIAGYAAGRGMGLARVAELNHYPGPMHVMDLMDVLKLSKEQKTKTQEAYDEMHKETSSLGRKLIDQERLLDAMFATGTAKSDAVLGLIEGIALIKAKIRFGHINAHITMRNILTPEQVALYDKHRGYAHDGGGHSGHNH